MSARKPTAKPITKSEFVRAQGQIPAKEIVARAARQGLKMSDKYVYVVRSQLKRKALDATGQTGPVRRPRVPADKVALLRQTIIDLGLDRSFEVLSEVASVLKARGRRS